MASVDPSEVDSQSLPAVSSLRSKFEQISRDLSPSSRPRPLSNYDHDRLSPEPSRHRQRTGSLSKSQPREDHQLRTALSSSDLKVALMRPPPPPPPNRATKPPTSPAVSPLLRSVPIPIANHTNLSANVIISSPAASYSPVTASAAVTSDGDNTQSIPRMGGVMSLRSKFSAPPASPTMPSTPRQNSFTKFAAPAIPVQNGAPRKPPSLPPRIPKSFDTSLGPHIDRRSSSDGYPRSESGSSLGLSPFESDSETSLALPRPPPLPGRNSQSPASHAHHVKTGSRASSGSYSSGSTSSESDSSSGYHSGRPHLSSSHVEKRPAPDASPHLVTVSFAKEESPFDLSDSPQSTVTPPPLPVRQNAALAVDNQQGPPRLPARSSAIHTSVSQPELSAPSTTERKAFSKHPPPPTRTIALGDKLPDLRRPPSPSSDEDSGDEEDTRARPADLQPDSSRSSRLPPLATCHTFPEPKIHVPAHTGHVVVAGNVVVVANNHHLKAYKLTEPDTHWWHLETKELGIKDARISCLEFRASRFDADRGSFVWVGTKEGHLFEVDVRTGKPLGTKPVAHAHTVTHIFRHGPCMVTLDDTGKVLVWSPGSDAEDVRLAVTQSKVFRVAEKQDFAKMLGGFLWTSVRPDINDAPDKAPVIRVYDVFRPGSVGRSLLPLEIVGAVRAGTLLPSNPHHVCLGHEGGYVSIWTLETEDGYPKCVEVAKVSSSDVLSLEGVDDRLWAGGRKGNIVAYDVSAKPWVVTNSWTAHGGLPVLKLAADPYSIEKCGMLCVVSVGRDERISLWDGLLGAEWMSQELLKREREYSTYRELKALIVSWNVDSARPENLTSNSNQSSYSFLEDVLKSVDSPDIISFGWQETIDLESRKMAAKSMFLGSKKKGDSEGLAEHVSSAYRRWLDALTFSVRSVMGPDVTYQVVHTETLVGLFSCIFVKSSEMAALRSSSITRVKCGMGGRYGNKGGIVARFVIDDSSICLINVHLAAGQDHVRQRNADIAAILEEKAVFPAATASGEPVAYAGGGDGSMVLDHEIVFVNGDMNYRIDQRREQVVAAIRAGNIDWLQNHDQLLREMKINRGFRLRTFREGPLTFAPTYKYDRHSTEYDTSAKSRVPAWCDRILWRTRDPARVQQLNYRRYEPDVSDHRPVSAAFRLTVKSVSQETRRRKVLPVVQAVWTKQQEILLVSAQTFYLENGTL